MNDITLLTEINESLNYIEFGVGSIMVSVLVLLFLRMIKR